eukprot:365390-Chlamydomonas_euryale.AAC.3
MLVPAPPHPQHIHPMPAAHSPHTRSARTLHPPRMYVHPPRTHPTPAVHPPTHAEVHWAVHAHVQARQCDPQSPAARGAVRRRRCRRWRACHGAVCQHCVRQQERGAQPGRGVERRGAILHVAVVKVADLSGMVVQTSATPAAVAGTSHTLRWLARLTPWYWRGHVKKGVAVCNPQNPGCCAPRGHRGGRGSAAQTLREAVVSETARPQVWHWGGQGEVGVRRGRTRMSTPAAAAGAALRWPRGTGAGTPGAAAVTRSSSSDAQQQQGERGKKACEGWEKGFVDEKRATNGGKRDVGWPPPSRGQKRRLGNRQANGSTCQHQRTGEVPTCAIEKTPMPPLPSSPPLASREDRKMQLAPGTLHMPVSTCKTPAPAARLNACSCSCRLNAFAACGPNSHSQRGAHDTSSSARAPSLRSAR